MQAVRAALPAAGAETFGSKSSSRRAGRRDRGDLRLSRGAEKQTVIISVPQPRRAALR